MSLEMLLDQFDGVIETAEDIKKLEHTIVQWAIQGKLGTQCPDDEPASALIERLVNVEDELEDARKSRKKKKYKPLADSEIPHTLPKSWEWVRLSKIGLINPRNDICLLYTSPSTRDA